MTDLYTRQRGPQLFAFLLLGVLLIAGPASGQFIGKDDTPGTPRVVEPAPQPVKPQPAPVKPIPSRQPPKTTYQPVDPAKPD